MNNQLITLIVFFSLTCFMYSCQTQDSVNLNQDKINTEYQLVYDKQEGKTYAKAFFNYDNATGTSLKLSDPAEVGISSVDTISRDSSSGLKWIGEALKENESMAVNILGQSLTGNYNQMWVVNQ